MQNTKNCNNEQNKITGTAAEIRTERIRVYGIVQGVGFRPTTDRHAASSGIRGYVCNKGPYVEIIAQGTEEQIENFINLLKNEPPRRAVILKIDRKPLNTRGQEQFDDFRIVESEKTKGEIFCSPDIAICEECEEELFDKHNRRYLHPFINCTSCGPRMTILEDMPYDRHRTSMKMFPMCRKCSTEYYDPESRRYDAQPVCCNECGPEVYIIRDKNEKHKYTGKEAVSYARKVISEGGIAAVKGIGGFHLCCDASNEEAVLRLRKRKARPAKPFAVMMRDTSAAMRECEITDAQREYLTGHQKPIILLERKKGGRCTLADSVAPGNPNIGVMLPYAPLHHLLFRYDDEYELPECLVMTSGNISGAPICRDDRDAVSELLGICDCILSHNRDIRIRADDSVMDFFEDKPYMIRRSRGYAPLPVLISENMKGSVTAVGGELKNTFCLGIGGDDTTLFYPSPFVGDLADIRTVNALTETIGRMESLIETKPELIVCDLHPKYNSTAVAEQLSREQGLPLIRVQHHYAHIASCMAENNFPGPVIGVSFDGTGMGSDGTIWGGEIMTADYDGFTRRAHIRPFHQIGGDASSRDGWRIALSMIYSLTGEFSRTLSAAEQLTLCSEQEARILVMMADKNINSITSTSAGRLFDAVSAVLGICRHSTFEGEASTSLQFAAEEAMRENGLRDLTDKLEAEFSRLQTEESNYRLSDEESPVVMQTDRIFAFILKNKLEDKDSRALALLFHRLLAAEISRTCLKISKKTDIHTAALSGGVFQNKLLLSLCRSELQKNGMEVLIHNLIPPNDGGIALGQAVIGLRHLSKSKSY